MLCSSCATFTAVIAQAHGQGRVVFEALWGGSQTNIFGIIVVKSPAGEGTGIAEPFPAGEGTGLAEWFPITAVAVSALELG